MVRLSHLWKRHSLCVLWLLMRRLRIARNKRSMSAVNPALPLTDKLLHYPLYLVECLDGSFFLDAFLHWPHICLSFPHGIDVSGPALCWIGWYITPSGMLEDSSTMEFFCLHPNWSWMRVVLGSQRDDNGERSGSQSREFLTTLHSWRHTPLIEMLTCLMQAWHALDRVPAWLESQFQKKVGWGALLGMLGCVSDHIENGIRLSYLPMENWE